jgi:hypothetical protein
MNQLFARSMFRFMAHVVKSDFAQNVARDIKSLRALWNWLYLALYAWICVWAVLHYPETISTAITVTGGVVSVIFTGYVTTKTYEKTRNGNGSNATSPSTIVEDYPDA